MSRTNKYALSNVNVIPNTQQQKLAQLPIMISPQFCFPIGVCRKHTKERNINLNLNGKGLIKELRLTQNIPLGCDDVPITLNGNRQFMRMA